MIEVSVDVAVRSRSMLGEGPVWDTARKALLWVDIARGSVHRLRHGYQVETVASLTPPVSAIALAPDNRILIALKHVIALLAGSEPPSVVASLGDQEDTVRFNDGKCDPAGRFFVGTMHQERPRSAGLYCLEMNHPLRQILGGITISNGLAWNNGGSLMYYIDTPTQRVDAFDYDIDTGATRRRRAFVTIDPSLGSPDGMAIDVEGCVWVCLYRGGAVHRYTPDGRLDRVVVVPASRVTSCAFGGATMTDLYLTSARAGLTGAELHEEPHAGDVFVCHTGVEGVRISMYGG